VEDPDCRDRSSYGSTGIGLQLLRSHVEGKWNSVGLEVGLAPRSDTASDRVFRKVSPYDKYDEVEFDVPVGKNGDCCGLGSI
jgi:hypothetical protein